MPKKPRRPAAGAKSSAVGFAARLKHKTGTDVLGPASLRALAAVLALWDDHGRALTLRDVTTRMGKKYPTDYGVFCTLKRLRAWGLVAAVPDRSRTTVPTCRFVPADKL